MANLRGLLETELQRLLAAGEINKAQLATQETKGALLGISKTQMNRLLTGKKKLTMELSQQLAKHLHSEPGERKRLAKELYAASNREVESSEDRTSLDNVLALFRRLSQADSLLCVEYRDLPRAGVEGKYASFTDAAGRAIAAGMHLAMFQPFGNFTEGIVDPFHTHYVRGYLLMLRDRVREVYHDLKASACKFADEEVIAKRIVLYERNEQEFKGSGIQSRLFYTERRTGLRTHYEIWEWIAAMHEDLFVERDRDSTPREVIADQFFPITRYWHKNKQLPTTNVQLQNALKLELEEAAKRVEAEGISNPKTPPESPWHIPYEVVSKDD
jgi:plasmid maintenance system antidote protein VapI